jgi:ABC-type Fe3+/spermidine/putrescine transport system ATPase subunit
MISVSNLNVKLGNFSLKDINLNVPNKECLTILGPNGSGKTTLLECIAGLNPCSGKVIINGVDVSNLPPETRKVGYVPQDFVLFPNLTADQNVAFGLLNKKDKNLDEAKRAMNLLGIEHLTNRDIRTLSAGEKQKVALARALAISPKVLLLDEPFSALDPLAKEKLRSELKNIMRNIRDTFEVPIIYVTHDLPEALMMSDQIAIMGQGKIQQTGPTREIINYPRSRFVAEFLGFNVLEGNVVATNTDMLTVRIGSTLIHGEKRDCVNSKEVVVAIKRQDIILSLDERVTRQKWERSQCNVVQGIVTEVLDMGAIARITIDAGIQLKSDISADTLSELELTVGIKVFAQFKTINTKIISNVELIT